jgi:hypothetical protein
VGRNGVSQRAILKAFPFIQTVIPDTFFLGTFFSAARDEQDAVASWRGFPLVNREKLNVKHSGLSVRDKIRLKAVRAES